MNILNILTIYMEIPVKNIIGFKGWKDYTSTFELDIIIIKNIGGKKKNNFSNSNNNKNYKKIKISKPDEYYSKQEKFKP